MTGFGRVVEQFKDWSITLEIKSLNSKLSDVRFRLPLRYREKEIEMRSIILDKGIRGKFEATLDVSGKDNGQLYAINHDLFKLYYNDLKELANDLNFSSDSFVSDILQIQGVVDVAQIGIEEEEWNFLSQLTIKAVKALNDYRASEGNAMLKDFDKRVSNISNFLKEIEQFEGGRVEKVKQRIKQSLEENIRKENIDENRFEQELIFYLERLDINEEKVRLTQHCKYFLEVLNSNDLQIGRKLTFIAQEMGREINTIGSKAYSSDIQRIVVKMKDELEKIKEQAANIV